MTVTTVPGLEPIVSLRPRQLVVVGVSQAEKRQGHKIWVVKQRLSGCRKFVQNNLPTLNSSHMAITIFVAGGFAPGPSIFTPGCRVPNPITSLCIRSFPLEKCCCSRNMT